MPDTETDEIKGRYMIPGEDGEGLRFSIVQTRLGRRCLVEIVAGESEIVTGSIVLDRWQLRGAINAGLLIVNDFGNEDPHGH